MPFLKEQDNSTFKVMFKEVLKNKRNKWSKVKNNLKKKKVNIIDILFNIIGLYEKQEDGSMKPVWYIPVKEE